MFYTYILYSNSLKKFYTGQSQDLDRRLVEHNRGKTKFLDSGKPWVLVYSKSFNNRSEAITLEKHIKKRGAKRFLLDNQLAVG